MGYWESVSDKIFLIAAMCVALIIYSEPIRWTKKGIPWFCLCIAGLVALCFLEEETRELTGGNIAYAVIIKNFFEIVTVVGISASMLLVKKFGEANYLFVCVAAYATFYLADNLNSFIVSVIFEFVVVGDKTVSVAEIVSRVFIALAVFGGIYTLCWYVFIKRRRDRELFIANKSVLIVFALILCINLFIGDMVDRAGMPVLLINKILSSILVLFVLYNQSNYLNTREKNARLEGILEQQKLQFESINQIVEQVNVKAHDLKHFVEIFQSRNDMPKDIIDELAKVGNAYENIYDTGNKALDITLAEKCGSFEENDMEFSILADGAAISFMSDVDIYVLFGNLLENAKEAVLREERNNRIIGLYIKRSDKIISLHVENTCTDCPPFSDGLPQTSKEDKSKHGFGTKSIQLVVAKYNGNLHIDFDGNLFTVDAVFFAE